MKDVGHRAASAATVCCAWADRCAVAGVQDFAAQEHCVSAVLQDRSHDVSIPVKEGGVGSAHWQALPWWKGDPMPLCGLFREGVQCVNWTKNLWP